MSETNSPEVSSFHDVVADLELDGPVSETPLIVPAELPTDPAAVSVSVESQPTQPEVALLSRRESLRLERSRQQHGSPRQDTETVAYQAEAGGEPAAHKPHVSRWSKRIIGTLLAASAVTGVGTANAESAHEAPAGVMEVDSSVAISGRPLLDQAQDRTEANILLERAYLGAPDRTAVLAFNLKKSGLAAELADVDRPLQTAAEVMAVDEALQYQTGYDPVVAKTITDPQIAKGYRRATDFAAVKAYTNGDMSAISSYNDRAAKRLTRLVAAADPDMQQPLQAGLDAAIAWDVAGLYVKEAEMHKPTETSRLKLIHDRTLRQAVQAIVNEVKDDIADGIIDDAERSKLTAKQGILAAEYYNRDRALETVGDKVHDEINSVRQKLKETFQASRAKLRYLLIENNKGLQAEQAEPGFPLMPADVNEDLDFSGLPVQEGAEGDETGIDFATLNVKDNRLVLDFADGSGLSSGSREAIERVTARVSPLMVDAFKRGLVSSIHFAAVASEQSVQGYYDYSNFESRLLIPVGGMTEEALQAMLTHEIVGHGLTFDELSLPDGSPESRQVAQACTVIRSTMYDDLQSRLRATPQIIADAKDSLPAEYRPIFDKLQSIVTDGDLGKAAAITAKDGRPSMSVNDCLEKGMDGVVARVGDELGISVHDARGRLYNDFSTLAYQKLSGEWNAAEKSYAVYGIINESNYARKVHGYEGRFGHSQQNAAELSASLINVSIQYPDKLIAALNAMSPADRQAALTGVHVSLMMASNTTGPEVRAYFQKAWHYIDGQTHTD
jgi:hypothetical protein